FGLWIPFAAASYLEFGSRICDGRMPVPRLPEFLDLGSLGGRAEPSGAATPQPLSDLPFQLWFVADRQRSRSDRPRGPPNLCRCQNGCACTTRPARTSPQGSANPHT